jgi:AraC family transcriptional regulator
VRRNRGVATAGLATPVEVADMPGGSGEVRERMAESIEADLIRSGDKDQTAPAPPAFELRPPSGAELFRSGDSHRVLIPFGTAAVELQLGDGPRLRTRLKADGVTLAEPGSSLRARFFDPVEVLLVTIDAGHAGALAKSGAGGAGWRAVALTNVEDPGVAALSHEIRRTLLAEHFAQPAYVRSLGEALFLRLLCRFLGEGDPAAHEEKLSPARLSRILRHIDEHLDDPLRAGELAVMAGLSRSHFSRAFQAATGDPPQRYVLKRRVCRARDLLARDDFTIAEIAVRSGFSSQAHLSTAFRDEVGTTPGRYRAAFERDTQG